MNKEDPFDGTWKLNPEKSHFDPNHRPSNATMRWECTSDGYTMTAEGIAGDGSVVREKPATFVPDGKETTRYQVCQGSPRLCPPFPQRSRSGVEERWRYCRESQLCRIGRWRDADHECVEHRRAAAPLPSRPRLGTPARL